MFFLSLDSLVVFHIHSVICLPFIMRRHAPSWWAVVVFSKVGHHNFSHPTYSSGNLSLPYLAVESNSHSLDCIVAFVTIKHSERVTV